MAPPFVDSADGQFRAARVGPPIAAGFCAAPPRTTSAIDILECPNCEREFSLQLRRPLVLSCGRTVCESCSSNGRHVTACDAADHSVLTENLILLQLLGERREASDHLDHFISLAYQQICTLAVLLRPSSSISQSSVLSRPMLRKLLALVNSNLEEPFGLHKALKAARSLAERSLVEVILDQQSSGQLTASLWAAVRARGCQFLGPAMQEEVLKLVLLALEDGSALSRKVLVMFVVQRLSTLFPHASKTSIGHVVQLLYRSSCFVVAKRDGDSSLMQLKEEFRAYESLRREHDAQIVSIACEAGLRIAPEQWSSLLYGDGAHRSHMQSIIDRLQTPQSLEQTAKELASLAARANHGPLTTLLQQLQKPLKTLEWQPEDVAQAGGQAVFDFVSAAVTTVYSCLSVLQQPYHNQKGRASPVATDSQQELQQQKQPQQLQHQHAPSPHQLPQEQQQQQQQNQQFNPQLNVPVAPVLKSINNGVDNPSNNNHIHNNTNGHLHQINGTMPQGQLPHAAFKYKVNLCRDINNFGTCPRGVNCTFAHSVHEQEHFRLRGKQSSRVAQANNPQQQQQQEQHQLNSHQQQYKNQSQQQHTPQQMSQPHQQQPVVPLHLHRNGGQQLNHVKNPRYRQQQQQQYQQSHVYQTGLLLNGTKYQQQQHHSHPHELRLVTLVREGR